MRIVAVLADQDHAINGEFPGSERHASAIELAFSNRMRLREPCADVRRMHLVHLERRYHLEWRL